MITQKFKKVIKSFITYFHLYQNLYGLWLWILIMLFNFEY